MKKILTFIIIYGCILSQNQDCIFDSNEINGDSYKKNKNFDFVKWNNETKEANIITTDGDFLYIKRWACEHYGLLARLIIPSPSRKKSSQKNSYWLDKVMWLAKQVLDKYDYNDLVKEIKRKSKKLKIKKQTKIIIKSESYNEFFAYLDFQDDIVVVSIFYSGS